MNYHKEDVRSVELLCNLKITNFSPPSSPSASPLLFSYSLLNCCSFLHLLCYGMYVLYVCMYVCILVRVTIVVMKNHDQRQLMEERIHYHSQYHLIAHHQKQ